MLFNWVGKFEGHPKKCLLRPISKGCSKSNFVLSYLFNWGLGFPGGRVVKNLPANAGDTGSVPGLGRLPEGGNGNPLQYSCLENSMGREA